MQSVETSDDILQRHPNTFHLLRTPYLLVVVGDPPVWNAACGYNVEIWTPEISSGKAFFVKLFSNSFNDEAYPK